MALVLLVEDDETLQSAYALALNKNGFEVQMASDGAKALELAAAHEPDVILLDLLMPHLDGVQFLEAFKPKELHPNVKVVVFTNLESDSTVQKASDLGAESYITKSAYTPKQMVELVNKLIPKSS